jgi:hypothetical protein
VPVETLERLINPATIADFKEDPLLFVKSIFRVSPTSQQEEVLRKFRDSPAVAIKSGHGVGKTAMEAWLILWFLFLNPMARIPCTAPTQAQLHDILWPEINLWLNRSILQRYISWSKSRVSIIGQDETWFAVARTSNKPANLQGFHGQALMYVVEEASGVPQEIMEVIEGAMTNVGARLLMAGNRRRSPGRSTMPFTKTLLCTLGSHSAQSTHLSFLTSTQKGSRRSTARILMSIGSGLRGSSHRGRQTLLSGSML